MQDTNMNNKMGFYADDVKYRCLCGLFDVVTGVKIFLTLFLIGICGQIYDSSSYFISFLLVVVLIVIAASTISAIIYEDHKLLLAFIVVVILEMILTTAFLLVSCYALICDLDFGRALLAYLQGVEKDDKIDDHFIRVICAVLIVLCLIGVAFDVWVVRVLCACQSYFKDKRGIAAENRIDQPILSAPKSPPVVYDAPPPYNEK